MSAKTFVTPVTTLLGIQYPVLLGGLTGVGVPELAAAVSRAGGLGMFAIHNAGSPEAGREWIRRARELCRGKPFGVNLTILPTMGPPPPYEEYARVIIEEGVRVVETAGSNPKLWIPLFKKAGIVVIHKCVTIRHALSAERLGVDIISLDGFECAGHPGEADIGNFVLQAKGAKGDVRGSRAGTARSHITGSAQGTVCLLRRGCRRKAARGGAGAGCLGRQPRHALLRHQGVQLARGVQAARHQGDCSSHGVFRCAHVRPQASEEDTVLLFRQLHNTARVFANETAKKASAIEKEKGPALQFADLAELVSGARGRAAERNNDPEGGIWSAGQSVGLVDNCPTVEQLMQQFMAEAVETVEKRLVGMVAKL